MANLRVQFDVTLSPPLFKALLVAALLSVAAPELESESVTLTTYYPAPSGVYTQMITTGNTRLARDGGNVGIRTAAGAVGSNLSVNGNMSMGTYSATAAPANSLIISGRLGVGTSAPSATHSIDAAGNIQTGGYIKIIAPACTEFNTAWGVGVSGGIGSAPGGAVCAGTQYATYTRGLYVEGWSYQNRGGQVVAKGAGAWTSTQVRSLDSAGNEAWLTLDKNDSVSHYYCCPR